MPMNKANLKNILTAVRDMINRSRIAYKDYLGEETVTETKVLVEGTLSEQGTLTLKDPSFTGFVVGEGYEVTIDGATQTLTAISINEDVAITNVTDFGNPGENFFIVAVNPDKGQPICAANGAYIGKTISISQTKTTTTKKYDIKKVPQELIPDTIIKSIAAVKTEAKKADSLAGMAFRAADNAQATADNAQTTANTAKTAAENAQSTAENAQSTADDVNTRLNENNKAVRISLANTVASRPSMSAIDYNLVMAIYPNATVIQNNAFSNCYSLCIVSCPKAEEIRISSFSGCENLERAYFPNVKTVSEYAFNSCSRLMSVDFPELEIIEASAFSHCYKLEKVKFPKVTTINRHAFSTCHSLKTADFSIVTAIHDEAFNGCKALTALILRDTTQICYISGSALNFTPIQNGTGFIYVPDAIVSQYKQSSGWSTYAAQIKPLSEYTDS